jgi:thymidine phosphorylase
VSWAAVDVVRRKRDGEQLPDDAVRWILDGFTRGTVAAEQMSALLMAIVFRGLSPRELATWTDAMVASGRRIDLSGVGRPVVDKHSSGGVGDKVSLVVAPVVASFGVAVPKLSGRGLGHTGGTLDKLESIPGWRGSLTEQQFLQQLREVGAVIAAATEDVAPADKALYALRDVTATVESVPLIASSIMSKKIAGGADAVLLDVKVGAGAFMPTVEAATELAEVMVGLGAAHGVRTVCLLTSMEAPLGRGVGNALEVAEAVETLDGGGPDDLVEVCLAVAGEMLALGGQPDADPRTALADGSARAVWDAMVRAQGGDPAAPLPRARHVEQVTASRDGVLSRLDARAVGTAAWLLGAGRARKEDPVSAAAGVRVLVRPGEPVGAGTPVLELHTDDPARIADARAALEQSIGIGDSRPAAAPLVLGRVGAGGGGRA